MSSSVTDKTERSAVNMSSHPFGLIWSTNDISLIRFSAVTAGSISDCVPESWQQRNSLVCPSIQWNHSAFFMHRLHSHPQRSYERLGWRGTGEMAQWFRAGYSCREPGFNSLHPHGSSQACVTALRDLMPHADLCVYGSGGTHACRQNTHTQTNAVSFCV